MQLPNAVLLIMGEGTAISFAGWIRNHLFSWRTRSGRSGSSDEPVVEKYPEGFDLSQEWDEMDGLTPWALDEIDRLQDRLKVSDKGSEQ